MHEDITIEKLKKALGKNVEVVAFHVSYVGVLKKIDLKEGTIRIEDKKDHVVIEIERIKSLHTGDA